MSTWLSVEAHVLVLAEYRLMWSRAACAFAMRWLSGGTPRVGASEGVARPSCRLEAPRGVLTDLEERLLGV